MVHAYLTGPKDEEDREAARSISIAYDPNFNRTVLKWEFDL